MVENIRFQPARFAKRRKSMRNKFENCTGRATKQDQHSLRNSGGFCFWSGASRVRSGERSDNKQKSPKGCVDFVLGLPFRLTEGAVATEGNPVFPTNF